MVGRLDARFTGRDLDNAGETPEADPSFYGIDGAFTAAGYYDFATPFFEVELDFARNGVVPERITHAYYEAGHMMYIHQPSLEKLMRDLRDFFTASGASGLE